jgi:tetratricopeptide (TPR) repeat protein
MLLKTAPQDTNRARIYGLLSWYYARTQSRTDIVRNYADSTMALAKKLEDTHRMAVARYYYGQIDRYEGNYEEALEHLGHHISYLSTQGDSSRLADGLYQQAVVQKLMSNYAESLATFYRILDIDEAKGNEMSIANQKFNQICFVNFYHG